MDSFIPGAVSTLQPSLCNYNLLIRLLSVHRPASGVDHMIKHAISSTNVDMLDQQLYGGPQISGVGYENTPNYHNRHASNLYGVAGANPPGSASNQNRPSNFRDQSSSSATNLMK